ncbi:hypothetical protein DENSPDRAFT_932458 [Dentipellis sp. KUC8613]|nr:hypothetical protein DENSPDRAFT_932458 [Dentipellis sp. KUC8613]
MSISDLHHYSFIFPHPDQPVYNFVELPLELINRRIAFLLAQACLENPKIPTRPRPRLFKPSGLVIKPRETLVERTQQWLKKNIEDRSATVELDPFDDITNEVFPVDREPHMLDLIIVTPEIEESLETVGELDASHAKAIRDREAGIQAANRILPSPSGGVGSAAALKSLFTGNGFHVGRPAGNYGPPVALFNPVLGLLAHRLSQLESDIPEIRPDHHERKRAHEFIAASLRSYLTDDERELVVQPFIDSLDPQVAVEWKKQVNNTKPDAMLGSANGFPYAIVELKNELGLHGDASTQARLSYAKIVMEDTDETRRIRKVSNCPAVVIGLMGDFVEIGITVYTDGPYGDSVFSQRMRLGFHDDADVNRIARAFKAVRLALADLRQYYEQLKTNPPRKPSVCHLFPSPIAEPSSPDHIPHITFTHRMSRGGQLFIMPTTEDEQHSGMYIGTMLKTRPSLSTSAGTAEELMEVVVKFTTQYNAGAHRILADARLAPALHACVPVCGGVQMVVMGRVKGEMMWCAEQRREVLPHTVYADVERAIKILHDEGLVFGDLRTPNIICVPHEGADDPAGLEPRMGAMLVDFDWVGEADKACYPSILNDDLGIWAPGVERGAIMCKEHDLYLLQKVKVLCQLI